MKERIFKIVGNNQKNPFRGGRNDMQLSACRNGNGGGYIPYIFLEIDDEDDKDMCNKGEGVTGIGITPNIIKGLK